VSGRMSGIGYRQHLRAVVAASAAPYGYTSTLWTAGAVSTQAQRHLPSPLDAMLLLAGAVLAFGTVGTLACGGVNGILAQGTRGKVRVWGGMHIPSVGLSIALVTLLTHVIHGHLLWPLVGFAATATYLLVIGAQFWFATRRTRVPEPIDSP
jgi:hypothetical protein